jgi:hypothetical protein
MTLDWTAITNPDHWKAFRIPAFSFATLALLMITRNASVPEEMVFNQLVAKYAIGTSIISYGHFLFHATWCNISNAKDLPIWAQVLAMFFHCVWFFYSFT